MDFQQRDVVCRVKSQLVVKIGSVTKEESINQKLNDGYKIYDSPIWSCRKQPKTATETDQLTSNIK